MKKFASWLLISAVGLICTVGQCTHVHDENCGYDQDTGEGCTHACVLMNPLVEREPNY